jgi:hypothetical protein
VAQAIAWRGAFCYLPLTKTVQGMKYKKPLLIAVGFVGIFILVGLVLAGFNSEPTNPVVAVPVATTTTPVATIPVATTTVPVATIPIVTTPAPVVQKPQDIRPILTASTDAVAKVFVNGKAILGSTQYSSATQSDAAFSDPNSPAVTFGAFRTKTCLQNDPSADVMNAYRTASDALYPNGNTDAVDAWGADVNDAVSAMCVWASDAVGWQFKDTSTSKLKQDEYTFNQDLAKARKDIEKL